MKVARFAAIIAALPLASCAQDIWLKEGATQADFNVEQGQCQMFVMGMPQQQAPYVPPTYTAVSNSSGSYGYGSYSGSTTTTLQPDNSGQAWANLGAALGNAARQQQAMRACMMSKGYTLQQK